MELICDEPKNDLHDQIIYRGEGNSSIVIALKNRAKVIRLLKKDGKIMKSSMDHHVTQHPMRSIRFIHLIMKPLTYPFLSGSTELVHLKSEMINMLSKRVEAERPLHRLDKTLHLDDQYALVMDDLCALPAALYSNLRPETDLCGPTISVEIKPKQGFLPIQRCRMKSTMNDPITSQFRNSCLYGSVQYLKLARGRIQETSNYCPVNLFSGCPLRMRSALDGLIKSPQNNFRIFKDLVLAYDDTNRAKLHCLFHNFFPQDSDINESSFNYEQRLVDLLIETLLSDPTVADSHDQTKQCNVDCDVFNDEENLGANNMRYSSCVRHDTSLTCKQCDAPRSTKKPKTADRDNDSEHRLPSSCVLASVLKAQQLDSIGAQEAREMLNWLIENSTSADVVGDLSKPQTPKGFGYPYRLPGETKERYYFRKVWEFLVSLTAKDCSIIITIRRVRPGRHEEIIRQHSTLRNHLLLDKKTGARYLYNVGIADLDQKMPFKINRICEHINQAIQQLSTKSPPRFALPKQQ